MLLFDLVVLRVWDPALLEGLRLRSFDLYQALQPRQSPLRPVVVVDIDEESLKAVGQWPWPRTIVADLVTRLTALGSVAIAFDMVFAEPDRASPDVAAESFRGLDDETRAKLRQLPSSDQLLGQAIARLARRRRASRLPPRLPGREHHLEGADRLRHARRRSEAAPRHLPGAAAQCRRRIEEAAAGRGLFSIKPERDGVVRRVPIVMDADGVMVPSLTLEMLRVVTGAGAILVRTDPQLGIKSVAIPGLEIPTDPNGQLWVHYGLHDPARYVSAKDVLEGRVPPERVAGKLVLVGTSAVGLLDLKTTPVDPAMPGVEVHAQVLENMLTKAMLSAPSYAAVAELAVAILVSLAIIVLAPLIGAGALLVLGAVVAAVIAGLSWHAYYNLHILFDVTFPLLTSFIIYLMLVFTNYLKAQAERKRIRSAFSQYLSPSLVEELAQSPDKLVLGGEERVMTVLFSDVRGFTTISELYKNDPQGLTTLMNRFLTPLTNAIIDRKGTIDKYIGDAIMAFWNAPLPDAEQEANACEAVLDMQDKVAALNRVRREEADRRRPDFLAAAGRDRRQHGAVRRRQHGLRPAFQLFGARRYGQRGLAAGRADEDLRRADHHRRAHGRGRGGPVRRAGDGLFAGQGKDRAGAHLHDPRPPGRRADNPLPEAARRQRRDAERLPQPELDRRAGGHPAMQRGGEGIRARGILQPLRGAHPHAPREPARARLERRLRRGKQVGPRDHGRATAMSIIRLIITTVPPDYGARAERNWKEFCAPLMIRQPGCLSEKMLRCESVPGEYISYSEWEDEASIKAYLASEDHQAIKRHNRNIPDAAVTVKTYQLVR